MTTSEVEVLIQNLKAECNCEIEHLSAIGALIIGNGNDDKAKRVSGPQLKGENLMKYLDNRMNFDYVDMDWIPVLDSTINRDHDLCTEPTWIGDQQCDDDTNNAECQWDGGDCCGPNVNEDFCEVCECLDPGNTPDQCVTTNEVKVKGAPCHFPFVYKNIAYNHCTKVDHNAYWCSTQVDSMGKHIVGKWGNCASSCPTGDAGKCDPGWRYVEDRSDNRSIQGKCIYNSYEFNINATSWNNSREACQELDADLVSISSQGFQDEINHLPHTDELRIFIGAIHTSENTTIWIDGSDFKYENWDENEPSFHNENHRRERCIHMQPGGRGKWNDVHCGKVGIPFYYMCAKGHGESHLDYSSSRERCSAGNTDVSCCSASHKCDENQGDCDNDSHCKRGLKCGHDNCPLEFPIEYDCC